MAYPFHRENPFSRFPTSDILSPLALALAEEWLVALPGHSCPVTLPHRPSTCTASQTRDVWFGGTGGYLPRLQAGCLAPSELSTRNTLGPGLT